MGNLQELTRWRMSYSRGTSSQSELKMCATSKLSAPVVAHPGLVDQALRRSPGWCCRYQLPEGKVDHSKSKSTQPSKVFNQLG